MTTDFNQFKCRCSSISKIMANSKSNPILTDIQRKKLKELRDKEKRTEVQEKEMMELSAKELNDTKVVLSDGCIEYLMEWYAWKTANKKSISKETMVVDCMQKGKIQEKVAIKLLSIVENEFYSKNEDETGKERLVFNEYLCGHPDIFIGKEIMKATKITDIKNCFDYPGFLKKIHQNIEPTYDNQIKGYMDITGAKEGEIAYCLVNMDEMMVNDYLRRLQYLMGATTDESPEYLVAAQELQQSMYFDDIPMHKRIFKQKIEPFTPEQQQKVYERVKICREWLFNFHETYSTLNK